MAVLLGIGSAAIHILDRTLVAQDRRRNPRGYWFLLVLTGVAAMLATGLDLWRWRIELPGQVAKLLVRLQCPVLRQITGGQDQINLRLLQAYQLDDFLQAVAGIHAQQRAIRLGEQMTVGNLHQQRRFGGTQCGYARQGVLPGRDHGIGSMAQLCWGTIERGNLRT